MTKRCIDDLIDSFTVVVRSSCICLMTQKSLHLLDKKA